MPRLSERVAQARAQGPTVTTIHGYPSTISWSRGGDILAVGADDGDVELIFVATDQPRQRVRAHVGPVQSIAWHPARKALLTTGQDGAIRLWEWPFSSATDLRDAGELWADHACWSPDGERAAVAIGTRAYVFAGSNEVVVGPVASTITGLAFTPSGKSLGIACYGGISLFDPRTGQPTRRLPWKGAMLSIAFSPEGGIVAGGCQDNSVHFWRIASGRDAQMTGFPAKPRGVAFNHDGRWLATAGDATITLWPFDRRGPEGRAPLQLAGHGDLVTDLAYAPLVDLLLSGARDGTVGLWAPPKLTSPASLAKLSGKVTRVAWGADVGAMVLRWAAADEHGRVLVGQV